MSWHDGMHRIEYLAGDGIVLAAFVGDADLDAIVALVLAALATAALHGARKFLFDNRAMRLDVGNIAILGLPDELVRLKYRPEFKTAIVFHDSALLKVEIALFEDAARGRGLLLRSFTNVAIAAAWLRGSPQAETRSKWIVLEHGATVRTRPGGEARRTAHLFPGTVVLQTEQAGIWLQIEYRAGGRTLRGWVQQKYLETYVRTGAAPE
jgi:hypothetical protein